MTPPQPLAVLLVEDSEDDAMLVSRSLRQHPGGVALVRVEGAAELSAALARQHWDIVISDFNMPGFSGLEALALVRVVAPDLPFILVSATVGEETAVCAMREGASDYVMKGALARLLPAVQRETAAAARRHLGRLRIERLSRVRAMTSAVNTLLVRAQDRDHLLRSACRIAMEQGGFVDAWVGAFGPAGDTLVAFDTMPDSAAAAEVTGAQVARAWRGRSAQAEGATAVIPLVASDRVLAALVLRARDAGVFDHEELRLLEELAADIAFALDAIERRERLDYLVLYDSVTGLANRALLHERLAHTLEQAARERQRAAVFVIDIDRFRTINDSLGRHAGDAVLREVGRRLLERMGGEGQVARLGGDHFALVLPAPAGDARISHLLHHRLADLWAEPFTTPEVALRVTATIGIALFPDDGAEPEILLRNAEASADRAKASGDGHRFYTAEITGRMAGKLALENGLRRALDRDEFELHYQPKVVAASRRIVGVEGLLRWRTPDGEWMPPAQFVPLLEETGMIVELGAWVLRRAVRDFAHLSGRFGTAPRIAVNVSSRQLARPDFCDVVRSALGGAAPGIDLEVVESLALDDFEGSVAKLGELRTLGLRVAIDDFGTGYSSLAYLTRLPADFVKIDRVFVSSLLDEAHAHALVAAIISLSHSLGLEVVAEGVETEAQAQALLAMGCDQLQGYLTGRPVPLAQLEALLESSQARIES